MSPQTRLFTKPRWVLLAPALFFFALLPASAWADTDDICGCAGSDSLGHFVMTDAATHPDGTVRVSEGQRCSVTLPAPEAGSEFLVFDSMTLDGCWGTNVNGGVITGDDARLKFAPGQPAILFVKGNVVHSAHIDLSGELAQAGSAGGVGGAPGPGGFVGGRGAPLSASESEGGAGIGPGGGLGGRIVDGSEQAAAAGGKWLGVPELRPLIGGGGGGGGYTMADDSNASCIGGGGGGGGGALLIAANGTIELKKSSWVKAKGGVGGERHKYGSVTCSSGGGGGGGGAIRLLAARVIGEGDVDVRGGAAPYNTPRGLAGDDGQIRIEAPENEYEGNTYGAVVSTLAPGPLENPVSPAVRITGIENNGVEAELPEDFSGAQGGLDLTLQAAGEITFALESTDVPSGTLLEVKATPDTGGTPARVEQVIDPTTCTGGVCDTEITVTLASGFYIVEARATFQVADSAP